MNIVVAALSILVVVFLMKEAEKSFEQYKLYYLCMAVSGMGVVLATAWYILFTPVVGPHAYALLLVTLIGGGAWVRGITRFQDYWPKCEHCGCGK